MEDIGKELSDVEKQQAILAEEQRRIAEIETARNAGVGIMIAKIAAIEDFLLERKTKEEFTEFSKNTTEAAEKMSALAEQRINELKKWQSSITGAPEEETKEA